MVCLTLLMYQTDSMRYRLASARLPSHLAGSGADPLRSIGVFHTSAVLTALTTRTVYTGGNAGGDPALKEQIYVGVPFPHCIAVMPKFGW